MGKIRCEKHGDQGIVLTCDHVRQDLLTGTSTAGRLVTIHAVVEFVDQTVAYCDTCAKQYELPLVDGVLTVSEDEFVLDAKPVCSECFRSLANRI